MHNGDWWSSLKHAFAIPSDKAFEPTPDQAALVESFCQAIHRRGLSTVALMLLESHRPLAPLAGQAMHFLLPFVSTVWLEDRCRNLADFLATPGAVAYVYRMLEAQSSTGEASGIDAVDVRKA